MHIGGYSQIIQNSYHRFGNLMAGWGESSI